MSGPPPAQKVQYLRPPFWGWSKFTVLPVTWASSSISSSSSSTSSSRISNSSMAWCPRRERERVIERERLRAVALLLNFTLLPLLLCFIVLFEPAD